MFMSFIDTVKNFLLQQLGRLPQCAESSHERVASDDSGIEAASDAGDPGVEYYFSDGPLTDPKADAFGRWPFAQRLARTLAERSESSGLVIALNGKWGEGKSTILNFIDLELKNHDNVITYRFNPWWFPSEHELLIGFFTGLADSLERSLQHAHEKIGEVVKNYITIPAAFFGRGQAVEKLGELMSSVRIDELKSRINTILKEEGKTVVILMDDIDRLEKAEIHSVFRLVKLTANFDHVVYVLAFDIDVVSDALQERYGNADPRAGRKFIEKVVQIPLDIPVIDSTQLRNMCFHGVDHALNKAGVVLSDEDARRFVYGFVNGIEIRLSTPRIAKRFTNSLTFSLPLVQGELDVVDFLLIEAIRVFFPDAYKVIKLNQDVFVGRELRGYELPSQAERDKLRPIVERAYKGLDPEERAALQQLLTSLFPRLLTIYGNTFYGAEWDEKWADAKRVASGDYVARYFTLGVPVGDVPDRLIDELLERIPRLSVDELTAEIDRILDGELAAKVIEKIRLRTSNLRPTDASKLAIALARNASALPNPEQLISITTPYSRGAMLVAELAAVVPPDDDNRAKLLADIIDSADPISFGAEVIGWLPTGESTTKFPFTDKERETAAAILAEKLSAATREGVAIFDEFAREAPFLASLWAEYGDKETLATHIQQYIQSDDAAVTRLLMAYVPMAYPSGGGLPHRSDFERSQYDALARVIDPEIIEARLLEMHGNTLECEEFPRYTEDPDELRVAKQFIWIHRHVSNQDADPHAGQPDRE